MTPLASYLVLVAAFVVLVCIALAVDQVGPEVLYEPKQPMWKSEDHVQVSEALTLEGMAKHTPNVVPFNKQNQLASREWPAHVGFRFQERSGK